MVVSIKVNYANARLRRLTIGIDHYKIDTIVTCNDVTVTNWIRRTMRHHQRPYREGRLIMGLGVQWTPLYPNDHPQPEPVATIQLCVGKRCLVYHLFHVALCTPALRALLRTKHITFVGLWSQDYADRLRASRHSLRFRQEIMPIDLRFHLLDHDGYPLRNASVSDIATEILGVDLWNLQQLTHSDWEVRDLTTDQVCHACVNAYFSSAIGIELQAWRFNPNRNHQ